MACVVCIYYITPQSTGFTALMFACKGGHLDTVMTLMRHGANPHIKNRVSPPTTEQHVDVINYIGGNDSIRSGISQ